MTNIRMEMYIFTKAFHPYEWLYIESNFSLQHHPWIKLYDEENKGNDQQLTKFLIVKQTKEQ